MQFSVIYQNLSLRFSRISFKFLKNFVRDSQNLNLGYSRILVWGSLEFCWFKNLQNLSLRSTEFKILQNRGLKLSRISVWDSLDSWLKILILGWNFSESRILILPTSWCEILWTVVQDSPELCLGFTILVTNFDSNEQWITIIEAENSRKFLRILF